MRRISLAILLGLFPSPGFADDEIKDKPILVLDAGGHTAPIKNLLFTQEGKELISYALDKTVRVWDVKTGEMVKVLRLPVSPEDRAGPSGASYGAALSPNGKKVKANNSDISRKTEWAGGKLVNEISGLPAGTVTETYSVDPELHQLHVVTTRPNRQDPKEPIVLDRVYNATN